MNTKRYLQKVIMLVLAVSVSAIFSVAASSYTVAGQQPQINPFPAGKKAKKFKGIVSERNDETFLMGETMGGPQTVVRMTASTEVKSHKRGAFRGSKDYGATYVLRGLRLEVDGVGNDQGEIVADKIRFDEQDLRTAQSLKATLDSVEAEMSAKLKAQQEENERQARQIEETAAAANAARAEAQTAAEAAKKAQQTADYANTRISGLDDFDPIKTITVYFNTNSSEVGPKAQATIDEAADWVRAQPDKRGWVVTVIGYADTTGNTPWNRTLSEKRANSVIYYLVTKHKMPLNKLVQPFGYGQLEPVAENTTAAGRAKNRRVEIRFMKNKGISGNVSQTQ
jgi:outer membrane protein OmpA-like peptidoglycan-associated protein